MKLLALADDLTGALETGAKFAAAGVPSVVTVDPRCETDAPVLVVDTETRHLGAAEATRRVHQLALWGRAQGARFLYKKTDSTLRGNIGAELGALRLADPESPLVYAPAYPALGRTVKAGRLYVDGVPVNETAFARDALEPVRECEIARVLAAATSERIEICDGETDADVARAAGRAARGRLAAGPAAMAEALARTLDLPRGTPPGWPPLHRLLMVNGSRHPAARAQECYSAARGWQVLRVSPAGGETAAQHAWRVGGEVRRAVEKVEFDALVIFGGDTAFGILGALGRPLLYPVGELVAGVALSRAAVDGRTLWLATKAGGFGPEDVLDAVRAKMEAGS